MPEGLGDDQGRATLQDHGAIRKGHLLGHHLRRARGVHHDQVGVPEIGAAEQIETRVADLEHYPTLQGHLTGIILSRG